MEKEDMQKPCKDIKDIEHLNAHQITDRKIIKALYNIYDDKFERDKVCERILARAKEFNSEVLVKDFILDVNFVATDNFSPHVIQSLVNSIETMINDN